MRDRSGEGRASARGQVGAGAAAIARTRAELAQLGVAEPTLAVLSRRLAPMIRGLSEEAATAALAGAALAHRIHAEQEGAMRQTLRDLGEMHRLLDAFGGELCRLDEALRGLSREVRRPRARLAPASVRQLH
jgi:hypothetical protein